MTSILKRDGCGSLIRLLGPFLKGGASNLGFQIGTFVLDFVSNRILQTLTNAIGLPGWAYTILTGLYPFITKVIDIARMIDAAIRAVNANSLFDSTPLANWINANISPAAVGNSG